LERAELLRSDPGDTERHYATGYTDQLAHCHMLSVGISCFMTHYSPVTERAHSYNVCLLPMFCQCKIE